MASALPLTLAKGYVSIVKGTGTSINDIVANSAPITYVFGIIDGVGADSAFAEGDSVAYRLDKVGSLTYSGDDYVLIEEIYLAAKETSV